MAVRRTNFPVRPLASIVAVAAIAAVCIPAVQSVTVLALATRPPAQVSSFGMSVDPDGCTVDSRVTVNNTTALPLRGAVWWDLSEPGAQPPWLHPRFQSTTRVFSIAAGTSATLTWREYARLATGSYDASYWVHVVPPGGSAMSHSDGGSMGSLLIAPASPDCQRPQQS